MASLQNHRHVAKSLITAAIVSALGLLWFRFMARNRRFAEKITGWVDAIGK